MKLLIAADSFLPKLDGVSTFLSKIAPSLAKEFDTTLIVPNFKGKYQFTKTVKIYKTKISLVKIANYNIAMPSRRMIRKLVKSNDVIFLQDIGPVCLYTLYYAKKYKKKIISYVHTIEGKRFVECSETTSRFRLFLKFLSTHYERWFYNSCNKLIISSDSIANELFKEKITTSFVLIPLGVDVNKIKPTKNKKLSKISIGLDKNQFVIGYLGRISKEKNLRTLRRAFEELPFTNKFLLIVGGGNLIQMKVFSNLNNKKITGFVPDPVKYLRAMDVYVLPSLTETSSLSTLEAMACELPVIATPVGSIPDYIQNRKNGLIFEKKNVEELKKLLEELQSNESLRKELGKNARLTAQSFSWEKTITSLIKLLKEI